jgi:PadR family transcriptional regulator PadR
MTWLRIYASHLNLIRIACRLRITPAWIASWVNKQLILLYGPPGTAVPPEKWGRRSLSPFFLGNARLTLDVYAYAMSKKPDNLQGALDLLILRTLASRGPMHGYGIAVHIERVSGDALKVEEGSLYPALHRIEQAGWISAQWKVTENRRRAKYYRLTAEGERRLVEEEESWQMVTDGISRVLKYT